MFTRLRRATLREWPLLAEIVMALAVARLKIAFVPFRRIAARLGVAGAELGAPTPLPTDGRARRIGRLIRGSANHLPWDCTCLAQAIVAKSVLSRRGIPCEVFLGVAPGRNGSAMLAHAWTRSGSAHVTGGRERQEFTVLARFDDGAAGST